MGRKKTTHMRVYTDDLNDMKLKFPKVSSADFFHMTTRTNPFIQVEALLRDKKKK